MQLKRLLYSPPHPHGPTPQCDFAEQKKITRAWALASSYLLWNARPDLSVGAIESALKPLGDAMSCGLCKEALEKRVKEVVVQWAQVKVCRALLCNNWQTNLSLYQRTI